MDLALQCKVIACRINGSIGLCTIGLKYISEKAARHVYYVHACREPNYFYNNGNNLHI